MRWLNAIASLALLPQLLVAQQIPAGTAIPIMFSSTVDARKSKPGQKIVARVMQEVSLPQGRRIRAGTRVAGRILEVQPSRPGSPSRVAFRFDEVFLDGAAAPVTTDLRALASLMEIFDAQLPTNNFDEYGTSIADWTTVQIGGELVYRGSGEVVSEDGKVVGKASIGGEVTGKLAPVPSQGCRGKIAENDREQSLWLFSTSACGVYGTDGLRIAHAGRSHPMGEIILESAHNVHVNGGSGALLRVQ